MAILKDLPVQRQKLKGDLATILSELDELNEDDAKAFIKWTCKKAKLYKKAVLHLPYSDLPTNMQRGDIVLCDFGINIFPEFSDKGTGKHFAVFWAQQGHSVIVIPITQRHPSADNIFTIPIGEVLGLPNQHNYIKLDAIRAVSLRRISRISGTAEGKLRSEKVVRIIKKYLEKLYISD